MVLIFTLVRVHDYILFINCENEYPYTQKYQTQFIKSDGTFFIYSIIKQFKLNRLFLSHLFILCKILLCPEAIIGIMKKENWVKLFCMMLTVSDTDILALGLM